MNDIRKSNAELRDIQYVCDELSQWTSLYFNIPCDNKVIKDLGYEKLEVYMNRLKELL